MRNEVYLTNSFFHPWQPLQMGYKPTINTLCVPSFRRHPKLQDYLEPDTLNTRR